MQRTLLSTTTTHLLGALALAACSSGPSDATNAESTTGGSPFTSNADETDDGDVPTTGIVDPATTANTTSTSTSTSTSPADTTAETSGSTAADTATATTTPVDTDTASSGHQEDTVVMTSEPAPTCEDGIKNQDESDVDCGGATCPACADGSVCGEDSDCAIASCIDLTCKAPTCDDGYQNQDETDVDCGGPSCSGCADNYACTGPDDCQSGVCTDGLCTPPSCADGVVNQDESDVDCGGTVCTGCLGDMTCAGDADCLSGVCTGGLCEPVECLVDNDCNDLDAECANGKCDLDSHTCVAAPANDGMACDDGNLCVDATTCDDGVCGGGSPKDCSALADACHVGACVTDTGECVSEVVADGTKCEDGNACTKLETCAAGVCGGSLDTLFTEDFSDNSAGWTLGPQWGIAPAMASAGCFGGNDPATDHSPSDDNGVAGVEIGKCITDKTIHDFYCLTSPVIDTSTAVADVHLSFWRLLHSDYIPYMKNKIEVWNGTTWTIVFETFGSPAVHDLDWKFFSYDVSAYKNPAFQARWCFNVGNTGVFSVASWTVDDVSVGPAACMP
jgi:hypothetical protein